MSFFFGAGGAPAWSPIGVLPNVEFWMRPSLGVTTPSGVLHIADQSGTGDTNKNLYSPDASHSPPISNDSRFNSRAMLRFNSTHLILNSNAWTTPISGAHTVFVVGLCNGPAGTNAYILDNEPSATNPCAIWADQFSSTPHAHAVARYGGVSYSVTPTTNPTYDWAVTPGILCVVFEATGTKTRGYFNQLTDHAVGNSAGTTPRTGVSVGSYLGSGGGPSTGSNWWGNPSGVGDGDGPVGDIIICQGSLSLGDITNGMNGLGAYYGIAIGP